MQEDLYLSFHIADLGKTVVIEGDGISVWAYLLKEDEEGVDFGGFLCSTGQPVEDPAQIERYLKEGNQPPLLKEYANEFSVVEDLKGEDIGVDALGTQKISFSIKGKVYLIMDVEEKQAYSIALAQDGPYGNTLQE